MRRAAVYYGFPYYVNDTSINNEISERSKNGVWLHFNDDLATYKLYDWENIKLSGDNGEELNPAIKERNRLNRNNIKVGDIIKFGGHVVMICSIVDKNNDNDIQWEDISVIEAADNQLFKVQKGRNLLLCMSTKGYSNIISINRLLIGE